MKTSEVLHRADLIEKRGWRTGSWRTDGDGLCIEGAIAAAMGLSEADAVLCSCPASEAVSSYLDGQFPFIWNDNLKWSFGSRVAT